MRRRSRVAYAFAAVATTAAPTAVAAAGFAADGPLVNPLPRVAVDTTERKPDRYKRRRVRFTPHARPTQAQVWRIINHEATRWNISAGHLAGRVRCESGMRWWAANGQYRGLGQFALSTFQRGLSTMPRGVRMKRSRIVRRRVVRVTTYSDGTVTRRKGRYVPVRRTRVYVGRIRNPDWLHGHAQLRIMAQAIAGRSAVNSSEWACR